MGLQEHAATPYLGMVLATTVQVGLISISKSALATGMSTNTFVAYSNTLAALILLPLSLLVHRASNRPPLSFLNVCGFFSLGVLGYVYLLTGYTGISYTNAEFASAMLNLVPGFTFVLAIIFRMEVVNCRNSSFLAKIAGTLISIAGAFVVTLYKGPEILSLQSSPKLHYAYSGTPQLNWILGGLFLVADCAVSSGYLIVQASILKKYPAELIVVFFYCFFAAILSALVSLVSDRDLSAWALQPNIRLIAVLYSGVFGSVFQMGVAAWCLHKRGPLFLTMFHPLSIVISAAIGIHFLGDIMYLGSLVGSVIIVIGFYSVMWGKAKEANVIEHSTGISPTPTSEREPLLPVEDEQTTITVKTQHDALT